MISTHRGHLGPDAFGKRERPVRITTIIEEKSHATTDLNK